MTRGEYRFYECENPSCALRFPGTESMPRWNRCPLCRSKIHIVASVQNPNEGKALAANVDRWQVDALLDNIRSAWNVGSIIRTSNGIGIRKIYICGFSPTPEHPKVKKTALGAETTIPWEQSNNGVSFTRELKTRGNILWALEDLPGATPLFQVEVPVQKAPIVLIVGNELSGIDPGIIELCDRVISIPMIGTKRSYNVAIAFSIAASFLVYRLGFSATATPTGPEEYFQAPY